MNNKIAIPLGNPLQVVKQFLHHLIRTRLIYASTSKIGRANSVVTIQRVPIKKLFITKLSYKFMHNKRPSSLPLLNMVIVK